MSQGMKGKGGKKKGKGKGKRGDGGADTVLVPWDPHTNLTDKMTLPRVVASEYACIKTSESNGAIVQSSASAVSGSLTFTSAIASDFSSLAAVFDQYKLERVEVWIRPQASQATMAASLPGGELYTVIDYDDAVALTSQAAALAYSDCVVSDLVTTQRRCLKPRLALAAYSGAFTSYASVDPTWIDCSSTGVLHYGVKYYVDQGVGGLLASWNVTTRALFRFRSTR